MKYMRIVALGQKGIFVQTSEYKDRDYKQAMMSYQEFIEFMKENFPIYWNEYETSHNEEEFFYTYNAAEFFYHYGETEEMKRKGIAYIYEA